MTQNPFLNAAAGLGYIFVVACALFYYVDVLAKDGFFVFNITVVLSLFCLSAGMMTYLFCYEPLRLFASGKHQEALKLFLKTLGCFAGLLLLFVALTVSITS